MNSLLRCAMSMLVVIAILAMTGCNSSHYFGKPHLHKLSSGYASVERVLLPPHAKFEATQDTVIHVKKDQSDFYVLLGPYNGQPSSGHYINPDPAWMTDGGYSYILGWLPVAKARKIVVAAHGTTMVIQLDGDTDRVYLLNPSTKDAVDVSLISDPSKMKTLKGSETYVEAVGPNPTDISDPKPIPTSGPLREFIDYVKGRATAAGLY